MLWRLGFKASAPALIPGWRRSFSEVASNFPFVNGGEGFKSRCYAGVNNSVISSSERVFDKGQCGNMHLAMAPSKQALSFPRHEVGVVDNLKPSLPSSIGDDDDFAELGPSLPHCSDLGSDLAKEKLKDTKPPGWFLDNESHQARRAHMQHSPGRTSYLGTPLKQDNRRSDINFDPINQNVVSRTNSEAEKQKYAVENNQTHTTISIGKVPPNISSLNLREAVSIYGEILSASLRTGPDMRSRFYVKFKSIESKERALAAQWITVKNCRLPVRDIYIPGYITVRISNISMETAEPAIHSMCMSCGDVAGLARTKEGAVDVVFRFKGNLNLAAQSILRRLNDVYYDDCRWSARLVPKLGDHSKTNASGSQRSLGSQINNLMGTFQKQIQMQRIYLEDLEDLHYAVLHLRDRPVDMHSQVRDG